MKWTARNWTLAGFVVVVIGIGAFIWSATGRGERDDDEQSEGKAMADAPESAAPTQKAGSTFVYNFDSNATGQLPAKFHEALTGGGGAVKWVVQAEDSAHSKPNVLAQTSSDKTDYRFPLAIADEGSFRDFDLSVKFKAVSGAIDRAAGLVFRLKDANNYYVVRANALEDNFNLYRVVNGSRQEIKGSQVKVSSGEWHELRVEAVGNKFTCYFDGDKKVESTDNTFKDAGKIGLWTKADSVTYFDELRVTAK